MQATHRRYFAAALIGAACATALGVGPVLAREVTTVASNDVFDGTFPKLPLPNKWTFGGVTGLAVDNDDLVWVLHRPNDLNDSRVPLATYKDFLGHVTVLVAGSDVYVADRQANRVQVFTKQGTFAREFSVAPETLGDGSAVGLALTKDGRSLFVADHMNNVVWLVDRRTDKVTARIGFLGRNGGGFNALHMVAVDSKGNLYTGEVDPNNRVQRFLVK